VKWNENQKNGQWSNFFELFVDDYGGILVPKLKLINPLDFEKLQKLDFTLLATDKGQLSGSMEVSIEIEVIFEKLLFLEKLLFFGKFLFFKNNLIFYKIVNF